MKDLPEAEPVTQPIAQARMRYIDTLRAVAALLVVWLHAVSIFGRTSAATEQSGGWLYSTIAYIDVGHIGVVVFFLISGFVIPFSISADRPGAVGSFAIRRFFRIYPAYWLSVPLAALAIFWIWGSPFSVREILVNLTLMQDLFGVRSAEGVYWTLPVELTFYALCIVLLKTNSLFDIASVALWRPHSGSLRSHHGDVLVEKEDAHDGRAVLASQSFGDAVWRAVSQPLAFAIACARFRRGCAVLGDACGLHRRAAAVR